MSAKRRQLIRERGERKIMGLYQVLKEIPNGTLIKRTIFISRLTLIFPCFLKKVLAWKCVCNERDKWANFAVVTFLTFPFWLWCLVESTAPLATIKNSTLELLKWAWSHMERVLVSSPAGLWRRRCFALKFAYHLHSVHIGPIFSDYAASQFIWTGPVCSGMFLLFSAHSICGLTVVQRCILLYFLLSCICM